MKIPFCFIFILLSFFGCKSQNHNITVMLQDAPNFPVKLRIFMDSVKRVNNNDSSYVIFLLLKNIHIYNPNNVPVEIHTMQFHTDSIYTERLIPTEIFFIANNKIIDFAPVLDVGIKIDAKSNKNIEIGISYSATISNNELNEWENNAVFSQVWLHSKVYDIKNKKEAIDFFNSKIPGYKRGHIYFDFEVNNQICCGKNVPVEF